MATVTASPVRGRTNGLRQRRFRERRKRAKSVTILTGAIIRRSVQPQVIERFDFGVKDEKLHPIDWDAFFHKFEARKLAFLYQARLLAESVAVPDFKRSTIGLPEQPRLDAALGHERGAAYPQQRRCGGPGGKESERGNNRSVHRG